MISCNKCGGMFEEYQFKVLYICPTCGEDIYEQVFGPLPSSEENERIRQQLLKETDDTI